MLISERGVPSSLSTLRLKSSPISSDILVNDSKRELALIWSFFSPPPLFSTDGIVKITFANYFTTAEIFATLACITSGFGNTSINDSVAFSPFPVT